MRALQLNSWQLFKLLQTQLPDLSCRKFPYNAFISNRGPTISECKGSKEKLFYCLYLNAATIHDTWRAEVVIKSSKYRRLQHNCCSISWASVWLSHQSTDRPVSLLAFGVAALITSCLILLKLLFGINKEFLTREIQDVESYSKSWELDEVFIFLGILSLVISTGSSSMIREEHYIWHFLTSTTNLFFFRKAIQSFDYNKAI